jgi:hypothetical protein
VKSDVLITSTIDAFEGRSFAIVDVPGAFLTADMDEEVYMCLRGRLAELMINTAPDIYSKYVPIVPDNKSIMYVKLQKALYGCMRSALLFYMKLVADLESDGFELNPYDPCVANKIMNSNQFTITWHVDDLNLSHMDNKEVTKTIDWLKSIYEEYMRVFRGKKHDYLGMDLDFANKGEVKITMIDYLKGVLEDFPEIIMGSARTPADNHMFTVREDTKKKLLDESRTTVLHHSVAQLLFASSRTRTRKDIQTTIAFMATREREPDKDEWAKLGRMLT